MTRISETELILPALFVMDRGSGYISTSKLIDTLTELLSPAGEDTKILAGRNDTKFSQKVRNLNLHKTLETRGFAVPERRGFSITKEGRAELRRHRFDLEPLFEFQFDASAAELSQLASGTQLHVIDERDITEGELRLRSNEYRTRSTELRQAAINHYSHEGCIYCEACEFEFARAYPSIGDGYIQIHHLKPVSFLKGKVLRIDEALSNVCPLCANCHQMVHRKRPPISVRALRSTLKVRYRYA